MWYEQAISHPQRQKRPTMALGPFQFSCDVFAEELLVLIDGQDVFDRPVRDELIGGVRPLFLGSMQGLDLR